MESASDFAFFGEASEESFSEEELEQNFDLPPILEEEARSMPVIERKSSLEMIAEQGKSFTRAGDQYEWEGARALNALPSESVAAPQMAAPAAPQGFMGSMPAPQAPMAPMPQMASMAPPPPPQAYNSVPEPRITRAPRPTGQKKYKQAIDTNVMEIKLDCLGQEAELATGDPITCANCGAYLNCFSELIKVEGSDDDRNWTCEFCGTLNVLQIEDEEVPQVDQISYIAEQFNEESKEEPTSGDAYIIFCIDISGSMCVSKEVSGKMTLKTNKLAQLQHLQTIEDGPQWMPGQAQVTYVSRLECVQAAIEAQIQELKKTKPNLKVGLVTFNNEVKVIGDGKCTEETIAGDKLYDFEKCKTAVADRHAEILSCNVNEAGDKLCEKLIALEESGPTALGPALIAGVSLAMKGSPGSKVIICTDGLANVGIGALEGLGEKEVEAQEALYEQVGIMAKDKGVTISVISIEGEECRLESLSALAEVTEGNLSKVDPEKLQEDFANVLAAELLATHANATIRLHKSLRFRAIDQVEGSEMKKYFGNVTNESAFTFEYTLKTKEELKQLEIDTSQITKVPFQVVITYRTLDRMNCVRVISKVQSTTKNRSAVAQQANYNILNQHAKIQIGNLVREGDYEQAQVYGMAARKNMMRYCQNEEQLGCIQDMQSEISPMINELQRARVEESMRGGAQEESKRAVKSKQARKAVRSDAASAQVCKLSKKRKY